MHESATVCTRGRRCARGCCRSAGRLPSRSCAAAIEVVTCAPATVGAPRARALHALRGRLMSESTGQRPTSGARIGVTGLAVMGANLARNIAHHGVPIAVHNRTASKTSSSWPSTATRAPFTGTESTRGVRRGARAPAPDHRHGQGRRAGRRRDRGARAAARRGRHHHRRRQLALRRHRAGATEECARTRPALPRHRRLRRRGGRAARAEHHARRRRARPTPRSSRSSPRSPPQVDGTPCCTYIGPDGAGHYVKMVHNGIEYADMQLIAEAYDLLRHGVGLEVPEIAQDLRRLERGRPRVVPDRDHREGARQGRRRRPASRWST